ncbi:MAG: N-acetylmuramoyl-L-alanine amidase [Alphaproteobacteria bacterium]|nr:N-acetylmuramoyl-L-alanine amidase [Alphaproteobacteria bacterium]
MKTVLISLGAALTAAMACLPAEAGAASTHAPGASAARVRVLADVAANSARAEIAISRVPAVKTFVLTEGKPRFVVDFEAPLTIGGKTSGQGPGAGPVLGYRFAPRNGGARLVFDLAAPDVTPKLVTQGGGLMRLSFTTQAPAAAPTLTDQTVTETADLTSAPLGAPPPAPILRPAETDRPVVLAASERPAKAKPPRRLRKTVVIDAGHGGHDSGAVGVSGVYEKDVTLAAAVALRDALEARGLRVVLTRDGDEFLQLPERVRRAREANADLFISLHADSNPNAAAEGASIYTLSERAGTRAKSVSRAQDWDLDIPDPPKSAQVQDILLDLAQRETKNQSAEFAQVAVRHLEPVSPLLRNARRNAGFFVLLAPDIPAILLEMGFMTNPKDEKRLTNARQRRVMMEALADAAAEFLAAPTTLADAR